MEIDYYQIILNTINKIFYSFINSIDNSVFSLLDETIFITPSILNSNIFNSFENLLSILNALLLGIILYYCIRLYISPLTGIYVEKPYQFITKLFFILICMHSSFFICSQLLNIFSLLTNILREYGEIITGKEISFNYLLKNSLFLHSLNDNFNFLSFSGMLKSLLSFNLISLLFSYSVRYILIKIFIFLFPFSLLSLISTSSASIFKVWFKNFFSLMFIQIFITIVLIFILSLNIKSNNILSQISYISSIFILTKANQYTKDLFGGISTDISSNLFLFKNLFK